MWPEADLSRGTSGPIASSEGRRSAGVENTCGMGRRVATRADDNLVSRPNPIDDDAMILVPAIPPEKGSQPMKRTRHRNGGLRKRCECPRKVWPKCPHSWFLNFRPKGGPHYRLSLDREVGRHIDSKTEAIAEAERIRTAIRNGAFHREPVPTPATLTLQQLGDAYLKVVAVNRPKALANERLQFGTVCRTKLPAIDGMTRPFGDWAVASVTGDDLEHFKETRLDTHRTMAEAALLAHQQKAHDGDNSADPRTCDRCRRIAERQHGGHVTINRNLALLRAMWNWAILKGHADRTPFKVGSVSAVHLFPEHRRHRRLQGDDEETRLLAACGPHLRSLRPPLKPVAGEVSCSHSSGGRYDGNRMSCSCRRARRKPSRIASSRSRNAFARYSTFESTIRQAGSSPPTPMLSGMRSANGLRR
jgi:hypothetical protein